MSPRGLGRLPEGCRPKHVALCFAVITQDTQTRISQRRFISTPRDKNKPNKKEKEKEKEKQSQPLAAHSQLIGIVCASCQAEIS